MRKAYDPHTNMVQDVTVDTSDLPLAKNVYDFCKNIAGKNMKMPFSRQLWFGWQLFGEWCPRCTDPLLRDITNVPVDEEPEAAVEEGRLVLLEYGVCPRCNAQKSRMVLDGELNDYNTLILVLGQRSGKSASSSLYTAYHYHRLLKAPKLSSICRGIQEFTPLTGTFVALSASRAIKLLWNPFSEIVKGSEFFCLAEGTQVSLTNGSKSIEEIQPGDQVKTFEGEQPVTKVFDNGYQECVNLSLESGHSVTGTGEHQVQCLGPDGTSLVWKKIKDLTQDDLVVVG
jgi:hypothetical protein